MKGAATIKPSAVEPTFMTLRKVLIAGKPGKRDLGFRRTSKGQGRTTLGLGQGHFIVFNRGLIQAAYTSFRFANLDLIKLKVYLLLKDVLWKQHKK